MQSSNDPVKMQGGNNSSRMNYLPNSGVDDDKDIDRNKSNMKTGTKSSGVDTENNKVDEFDKLLANCQVEQIDGGKGSLDKKKTTRKTLGRNTTGEFSVTEINMENVPLKPVSLAVSDLGMQLFLKMDDKFLSAASGTKRIKNTRNPAAGAVNSKKAINSENTPSNSSQKNHMSHQLKVSRNLQVVNRSMKDDTEARNYLGDQFSKANVNLAPRNGDKAWRHTEPVENSKAPLSDIITNPDTQRRDFNDSRELPVDESADVESDFDARVYHEWLARRKIEKRAWERDSETVSSVRTVNYKDHYTVRDSELFQDQYQKRISDQAKVRDDGRAFASAKAKSKSCAPAPDRFTGRHLVQTKNRNDVPSSARANIGNDGRYFASALDVGRNMAADTDRLGVIYSASNKVCLDQRELIDRDDRLDQADLKLNDTAAGYRPNERLFGLKDASCKYPSKSLAIGGCSSMKRCNKFSPPGQPETKMKCTYSRDSNSVALCQQEPGGTCHNCQAFAHDKVNHNPTCGPLRKSSHCEAATSDGEIQDDAELMCNNFEKAFKVCCCNVNNNTNGCMACNVNQLTAGCMAHNENRHVILRGDQEDIMDKRYADNSDEGTSEASGREPQNCLSNFDFANIPEGSRDAVAIAKFAEYSHNLRKDFKNNYAKMNRLVEQFNGQLQPGKRSNDSDARDKVEDANAKDKRCLLM